MTFVPVTILGGLPVIASVWFSGPDYEGHYDAGCDGLYWQNRDGTRGAPLSERMMDRVEKQDEYWQADVTEKANDWLGYEARGEDGELTEAYLALNPRKKQ